MTTAASPTRVYLLRHAESAVPHVFHGAESDVGLSEPTCGADISGCTVPPAGPGSFYPYWSTITNGNQCSIVFGNVTGGAGVNDYGADAQYGPDLRNVIGYDEFESPVTPAVC